MIELLLDLGDLTGDVRVSGGQGADAGEGGAGLFPTVLTSEPAGRLVAEPHGSEEQDGWKPLHDEGNNVLGVARDVHVGAVVDPESKHDTAGNEELVNTGQATANGTRGVLGDYIDDW